MPAFSLPTLSSLLSWRNAALLFALLNLKVLPLAWHLRLLRRLVANTAQLGRVRRAVKTYAGPSHPIFEAVCMSSRAPLLECDYNLHKSNSTFFSDLDESRTALATRLLVPGMREGGRRLEAEGKAGSARVILGSVHCTYHREIRPYERYEVRSRVLGWDAKWLVIGSWFVRPGRQGRETVLASALSKYVIKKGRWTVSPERALQASGWLPEKPAPAVARSEEGEGTSGSDGDAVVVVDEAEIPRRRDLSSPMRQESTGSISSSGMIVAPIPEKPLHQASMIRSLEDAALKGSANGPVEMRRRAVAGSRSRSASGSRSGSADTVPNSNSNSNSNAEPGTASGTSQPWDWYRIDQERRRGLGLAEGWLELDKALMEEALRPRGS